MSSTTSFCRQTHSHCLMSFTPAAPSSAGAMASSASFSSFSVSSPRSSSTSGLTSFSALSEFSGFANHSAAPLAHWYRRLAAVRASTALATPGSSRRAARSSCSIARRWASGRHRARSGPFLSVESSRTCAM